MRNGSVGEAGGALTGPKHGPPIVPVPIVWPAFSFPLPSITGAGAHNV